MNNPASNIDPTGQACYGLMRALGACNAFMGNGLNFGWNWNEFDVMNIPVVTTSYIWVPPSEVDVSVGGVVYPGQVSPGYWAASGTVVGSGIDLSGSQSLSGLGSTLSWWGTFATSFVKNLPSTTWESLTSGNGCLNRFFTNSLYDLSPIPTRPGASDLVPAAANALGQYKINSALAYAASRTNYLGGQGLMYPFKSSVFQSLFSSANSVLEATPMVQLDIALLESVISEGVSALKGECQ